MSALLVTRSLLVEGIVERTGTAKEGARQIGISSSMLSKIGSAERALADDLKPKVCGMSLKAGLMILKEVTGYNKLFSFFTKDRHPQNLIRRAKIEDVDSDRAFERIADRLTDKPTDNDLTPEDIAYIQGEACEIAEGIEAKINALVGLAERYPSLRLEKLLTNKEKICSKAD